MAIGEITAADPSWELRLPFMRDALVEQLRSDEFFTRVLDPAPETLPADAVLLTGEVTEVEKGNRTLRWLIGFGAGSAHAIGNFELSGDDGATLASFESRKAYAGGFGIGGLDLVDIDELMEKLGEETGKSIGRWARGEDLAPPQAE